MNNNNKSIETIWNNLVDWVQAKQHGGHVHSSIKLVMIDDATDTSSRGVIASQDIPKGELLIRIPSCCVISGQNLKLLSKQQPQEQANNNNTTTNNNTSSWLQCVAAYFLALQPEHYNHWQPYLNSLPSQYETLFQWNNQEIETYLAGTTLGEMVSSDRNEHTFETRYKLAVLPYLKKLGLVTTLTTTNDDTHNKQQEWETFLQACMCISTRGFHYDSTTTTTTTTDHNKLNKGNQYNGPFLLPIIDLLNHNPKQACTTLQYDDTSGTFVMVAERDIRKGEDIVHSYGESLTSAQLLQTFGFVMPLSKTNDYHDHQGLTPVGLSKTKHFLPACKQIKESTIPNDLASWMESQNMDDEHWQVNTLPVRDTNILMDDVLVEASSSSSSSLLTDEMITFFCLQFLPQEAYDEIGGDSTFDSSILEDFYLGILVSHALLISIHMKLSEYTDVLGTERKDSLRFKGASMTVDLESHKIQKRISAQLEQDWQAMEHFQNESSHIKNKERAIYGLTIRIEELTNLKALYQTVCSIIDSLHQDQSTESDLQIHPHPPSKRLRTTNGSI